MIIVVKSDRQCDTRVQRLTRWLERREIEHRIARSPFDENHEAVIFVDDLDLPLHEAELDRFTKRVRRLRDVRKVLT